jgi:hypothetical protein
MTTEERIERTEKNLHRLAVVQDEMMDLLGMTVEGERRLATRTEEMQELQLHHDRTMKEIDVKLAESAVKHVEIDVQLAEIGEKLNALIGVVDGFIRGKG